LLLGDAAVEKCITATESEIAGKHIIIELLEGRLEDAKQMNDEEALRVCRMTFDLEKVPRGHL
jgi:hypothetical protein